MRPSPSLPSHGPSAGLFLALAAALLTIPAGFVAGQQEGVKDTLHNLSTSGPGELRSTTEDQICKFCHIPHNSVRPEALWGHTLSTAEYRTARLSLPEGGRESAPQPDGSSRLCLSCHDGTVALGDLAGRKQPVEFQQGSRIAPGRRGYLGTDLSGSHPISFVVPDRPSRKPGADMSALPPKAIAGDPAIRLDGQGKMQCTTCHDPHSDRYYRDGRVPRFWVKPTVDEVCKTCHVLS